MTHEASSTMASSEAADTSFKTVVRPSKSKRLKVTPVQKTAEERTHSFTIRAYFPLPPAKQKFLPIPSMRSLFTALIKVEPSIIVVSPNNDKQLELNNEKFPTTEAEFKKFFTVSMDTRANTKQQHIIVGCAVRSERILRDIKFDKTKTSFLDWLANEKVFVESDALGVSRTVSIGYLARLHPQYTNKTNLKHLLHIAFDDVHIDPKLAVELDPSIKPNQTAAAANGDTFVTPLPPFELYKTKITHGRDKDKVSTDIIGIKCAADKARLLKEFFSQLASPASYEKQIGFFIPTGAAQTLGQQNYAKLISENHAFVTSVVTIPVGDFQHATLDIPFSLDKNTDIDQLTLQDILNDQPWCLSAEKTMIQNKIMITTTKDTLEQARKWIDHTLVNLYEDHIEPTLNVTTLKLKTFPRRLDLPMQTAASMAYTKNLCARATYAKVTTATHTTTNQTKQQSKTRRVDVSFTESDFPALPATHTTATSTTQTATATNMTTTAATAPHPTDPPYDYKVELERRAKEIEENLKPQIERLFQQLDHKIDALAQAKVEQDQVNVNVSRQLDFLVDAVKKLLKDSANQSTSTTQPPRSGGGR